MSIRVRFKVETLRGAGGDDQTVVFVPIADATIPAERQVSKSTPSGRLELFIANPEILALLPIGEEVFVDIAPVALAECISVPLESEAERQARLGVVIAGSAESAYSAVFAIGDVAASSLDLAVAIADLNVLQQLEKAGKNRTTVLRAISERLDLLSRAS